MSTTVNTLDVRADFRSGQHPRERIQNALNGLSVGEALRLLVPFEPVPLLHWANSQGLTYQSNRTESDDWDILFTRGPAIHTNPAAATVTDTRNSQHSVSAEIELDARGLEPPQPLMRILEEVTRLPRGARLHARTDRRPIHLYSSLQERGFTGESEEQPDGSFITHIQHA